MADSLEKLILAEGPETVAAFIGEPIMGAIGVYIPPMSYWPEIERICRNATIESEAKDRFQRGNYSFCKTPGGKWQLAAWQSTPIPA